MYAKSSHGWYFATVDYDSASLVTSTPPVPWSNPLGGFLANNYYSGIGIGPDGSAYVGFFGGIVAWRPAGSAPVSGHDAGAAASALMPDLFTVGTVNAGGLLGLNPDAGGPTRTAPVADGAFPEALNGPDQLAAVEASGDNQAEQVVRTAPPALDLDLGVLRQLDGVFALDQSSWLGQ